MFVRSLEHCERGRTAEQHQLEVEDTILLVLNLECQPGGEGGLGCSNLHLHLGLKRDSVWQVGGLGGGDGWGDEGGEEVVEDFLLGVV